MFSNLNLSKKLINFSIIIGFIFLFAVIYTIVCPDVEHWKGINKENDKNIYDKFFNRLYFSFTTMSTIGYGDISPVSKTARSLVLLQMFLFLLNIYLIF